MSSRTELLRSTHHLPPEASRLAVASAFTAYTAQTLSAHPWPVLAGALTEAKESPTTDSSAGLAGADMTLLAKAGYSDSLIAGCTIAHLDSA
jgi:hypothetical protein